MLDDVFAAILRAITPTMRVYAATRKSARIAPQRVMRASETALSLFSRQKKY